jgi:two-component system, sensor histidine kinase PdtaS
MKSHGRTNRADIEWLHLLQADWQLVADLTFADLVLWIPDGNGSFVAAGHARPSSAATLFYRDITGKTIEPLWLKLASKAFKSGEIADQSEPDNFQDFPTRLRAIPVFRRISANDDSISGEPIAVITRHTNLAEAQAPNRTKLNMLALGDKLLVMVTDGSYPTFSAPTAPRRGAPRANDGLLELDIDGNVMFSSPNGLSAFSKMGVTGELEGKNLPKLATEVQKSRVNIDEALPMVVTGKSPWRADIEANSVTLSLRSIPIYEDGTRTGAILLCRDVTELRRQERELITKDATIREIHHRVKNNLQTVASLLRIQARRTDNADTIEALQDAQRRVAAIALVHDTLSEGLSQAVDFDEVFDRIMAMAAELAAAFHAQFSFTKDGKFGAISSEMATPLAVVLTEIVTNALEHGLANRSGTITVASSRKGKKLMIGISDDGAGIADDKIGSGLGTQLIRTLVEGELRGSIDYSSKVGKGTYVALEIPLS